jgi:hypothetical protein
VKYLAIVTVALLLVGCQSQADQDLLEKNGYTHVEVNDGAMDIRCGPPQFWALGTSFKAVNPKGKKVKGSVCHFFGTTIEED